ncbi:uncharacterized protein A4U43_C07F20520 [Asparagus officinalis]|uniref:Uncharacterized protein n=1 Tax=Asparagus officinalis TaxID=4686 RepID=A0A5P1EDP6_ASPOF|nr:uncharacterized protein A4U43_C07F20520 [Asparagus officinalis]
MSPPMSQRHHRDSSPGLDNHHDGSDDDEIQHESFARSSQSEVECLRPWTEAVNSIPLPEKAITLQKKCDRNYKKRREDIKNKDSIIKQRLEKAMSDKLREMGNKDYEKAGRHGSDLFTKVPPKGYRAILGWMGNIPVGDYAVRFNNLIGCLIRDPHHINIAHNFDEQQWNGIKKIWERLMIFPNGPDIALCKALNNGYASQRADSVICAVPGAAVYLFPCHLPFSRSSPSLWAGGVGARCVLPLLSLVVCPAAGGC